MSGLHRLVYCSESRLPGSVADLQGEIDQILAVARRNNQADGISGALLFSENWFAQVLEGPVAAIERTFERIQCDPRHADVTVLELSPARGRRFGDWSMAYAGGPSTLGGLRVPSFAAMLAEPRAAASRKLLDMLRTLVTQDEPAFTG